MTVDRNEGDVTADLRLIREALLWKPSYEVARNENHDALAALSRVEQRLREAEEALRAMLTAIENHADPSAVALGPTRTRKLVPSLNLRDAMAKARAVLAARDGGDAAGEEQT